MPESVAEQPRLCEFVGTSTTGTKHGLLVAMYPDHIRFTVTGANGKKHAAVLLDHPTLHDMARFLGGEDVR